MLTDERSKAPEDLMIEADDLDRIIGRLDELEDREATVVRMRFGLEPFAPMTLREVGENLGLTHERVRQLETRRCRSSCMGSMECMGRVETEREETAVAGSSTRRVPVLTAKAPALS